MSQILANQYDQHKYYMDQIGDEYWNQPWTKPFAKEEIGVRKSKNPNEEDVYGFISNLSRDKLIELSSYLSGVMVNEYTDASTTALINAKTRNWDYELIKK